MQEFLFLLLAGDVERVLFGQGEGRASRALGYEDFMALRPQVGESSWRVTASRLQKQRLIAKVWEKGVVRYQLTKLGYETISREFVVPPHDVESQSWFLCILAPQETAKPQHAAARRVLMGQGYINLVPGLYIRLWSGYSGDLAKELQSFGFVPCFLPVNPKTAQPASLDALLYEQSQSVAKKNRKITQFSEEVDSLLKELSAKNALHSKDKQRVGTILLSGLNLLHSIESLQFVLRSPRPEMEELARGLDSLMRRFLQQ